MLVGEAPDKRPPGLFAPLRNQPSGDDEQGQGEREAIEEDADVLAAPDYLPLPPRKPSGLAIVPRQFSAPQAQAQSAYAAFLDFTSRR